MAHETEMNQHDEDSFGLPDIEYKPLDQIEGTSTEANFYTEEMPEEQQQDEKKEVLFSVEVKKDSSNTIAIVAVIISLAVGLGGFALYKFIIVPKNEKARSEKLAKIAEEKKIAEENKAREAEQARLKKEADTKAEEIKAKANVKPSNGTIETLSQPVGRFFVIISSSVDGDLAMDLAKKLSAKGISSKIINPFGNQKYFRLGIGDFDTFADAQSSVNELKATYGEDLWVMKY